ncbi:serine/threonine-protein phosphatase with EF-hands 2-like isoform X2 [Gigantopelta aegis]|uniref:serine/threonine-protein phosphatase with EF-hands 2-like isoform X2 n=1 Tax=Gigantopelta aegis TaxID=1735272 RepID=UPI001B8874F5|nr:serine/threonine-protein phosphatase with EF-hands 2-like isoform X2 [Gigantopelta aegis]
MGCTTSSKVNTEMNKTERGKKGKHRHRLDVKTHQKVKHRTETGKRDDSPQHHRQIDQKVKHSTETGKCDDSPELQGQIAMKAAILIQKWYRQSIARLEARRQCTWNIFQTIEYAGEQDQLKLYNFFNGILMQIEHDSEAKKQIVMLLSAKREAAIYDTTTEEEARLHSMTNPNEITIDPSYKGPRLTFPLTLAHVKTLIKAFKMKQQLHVKYLLELLHATRKMMKTRGNINYASTSIAKQITVCGDLHGKLDDLYMIFHKNGLPSVENPYIFNGDFVDRGPMSIEICVILFSCCLTMPNEVYLNRGNHEDHVMNLRYGFVKEIMRKYKEHSVTVARMFEELFSWLPLATVIDDQVLVVHGGVSDQVDLEVLAKLDRHKYVSVIKPPFSNDLPGLDGAHYKLKDLEEWRQVQDILWSDPRPIKGSCLNKYRGGGSYFGPDVTERFLERNNLTQLIRSHECKIDGYEYTHNDKVLTIFSASNYYDFGSNKGAYVKLQGQNLKHHIVQYIATTNSAQRKLTFTQRVSVLEASALHDLRAKIVAMESDLIKEFEKYDCDNKGTVSLSDWCTVMGNVVSIDIPWHLLQPKLVKVDPAGHIQWRSTFENMRILHRYNEQNEPSLTEMLYRHKDNLETIFRIFDTDNSGFITIKEFEDACSLLMSQSNMDINVDMNQFADIARSMDFNKDGQIDFNEFLEAFRIVDLEGRDPESHKHHHGDDMSEIRITEHDDGKPKHSKGRKTP